MSAPLEGAVVLRRRLESLDKACLAATRAPWATKAATISAPIFDATGTVVMTVSAQPYRTLSRQELEAVGAGVVEFAREVEASSNMPVLMQTMMTLHVQQYRKEYHADLESETIAWLFINSAITTTLFFFESGTPVDLEQLRRGLKRTASGLLVEASPYPAGP